MFEPFEGSSILAIYFAEEKFFEEFSEEQKIVTYT